MLGLEKTAHDSIMPTDRCACQEKSFPACQLLRIRLYYRNMGKKVRISHVVDVTELGRAGGKATAANRSSEQRSDAGRHAGAARWEKYYAEHPEKLKAKKARARKKPKSKGKP